MPVIDIVLVSPLYEGNIGFTARVMKNFGFSNLVLVHPCPIRNEAFIRAAHARDVLDMSHALVALMLAADGISVYAPLVLEKSR